MNEHGRPGEGRETRILGTDEAGVQDAAGLLRAGGLVAFPTETVYGLGANALDADAVAGIFRAKGRPADDPLIVHVAEMADLDRVARAVPPAARLLAERLWPGPLTLVLPKRAEVPPGVTAGLDTVAVRVPSHPVAQRLLRAAGVPIAAPSANLFARPSPTRAEHVLEDLAGRIDAVVDGGPTRVGVESTIVDVRGEGPARVLRYGGVPVEVLEALLGGALLPPPARGESVGLMLGERVGPMPAPGLLEIHYAPRTPLTLVMGVGEVARRRLGEEVAAAVHARGQRVGVLLLEEDRALVPRAGVVVEVVGSWADPEGVAARLFDALRALDRSGAEVLLARYLADPSAGVGRALADRLQRASARRIDPATDG